MAVRSERYGFGIVKNSAKDGSCPACGEPTHGAFLGFVEGGDGDDAACRSVSPLHSRAQLYLPWDFAG